MAFKYARHAAFAEFLTFNLIVMKKFVFRGSMLGLSMSLIMLFAHSCTSVQSKEIEEVFQVTNGYLTDTVAYREHVAELMAFNAVEIRNRVKGFVEAIFVDEGQEVKKGQVLFRLSSDEYRQELEKANAQVKRAVSDLRSAEIELSNAESLLQKKIIGKPERDMLEAKVDALKANVSEAKSTEAQARLHVSFTEICAPFNGVVNRIPYKIGSLIEEGTLLTKLSDPSEIFAYFNLSESDYLNLIRQSNLDQIPDLQLILANNTLYNQTGKVEAVETEVNTQTGTIGLRARFKNEQKLIRHGSAGKVRLPTVLNRAILIPQRSTFEVQGNVYVMVVKPDFSVEMRRVEIESTLPNLYAIRSGLKPSEKFVFEGFQRLNEGDKIRINEISFLSKLN
jgi:membrane fusion protein (multidrug efflux system)